MWSPACQCLKEEAEAEWEGVVHVGRQGQSARALGPDRAAAAPCVISKDPGTGGQTYMFSCLGECGD